MRTLACARAAFEVHDATRRRDATKRPFEPAVCVPQACVKQGVRWLLGNKRNLKWWPPRRGSRRPPASGGLHHLLARCALRQPRCERLRCNLPASLRSCSILISARMPTCSKPSAARPTNSSMNRWQTALPAPLQLPSSCSRSGGYGFPKPPRLRSRPPPPRRRLQRLSTSRPKARRHTPLSRAHCCQPPAPAFLRTAIRRRVFPARRRHRAQARLHPARHPACSERSRSSRWCPPALPRRPRLLRLRQARTPRRPRRRRALSAALRRHRSRSRALR